MGLGGPESERGEWPDVWESWCSVSDLGLCLLPGAPSALLLLVGPGRRLGRKVLRGPLRASPQVLSALNILELGAPQCLHRLILEGNKTVSPPGEGGSPRGGPPAPGLTMRFCSFSHCSLNSFLHFSISILLAARGCGVEEESNFRSPHLFCFLPSSLRYPRPEPILFPYPGLFYPRSKYMSRKLCDHSIFSSGTQTSEVLFLRNTHPVNPIGVLFQLKFLLS